MLDLNPILGVVSLVGLIAAVIRGDMTRIVGCFLLCILFAYFNRK